jgi:hypothetical protein
VGLDGTRIVPKLQALVRVACKSIQDARVSHEAVYATSGWVAALLRALQSGTVALVQGSEASTSVELLHVLL